MMNNKVSLILGSFASSEWPENWCQSIYITSQKKENYEM